MFYFYIHLKKQQKTSRFLMFSRGREMENWLEMGQRCQKQIRRCSTKLVFWKDFQNSQGNIRDGVALLVKLQAAGL